MKEDERLARRMESAGERRRRRGGDNMGDERK